MFEIIDTVFPPVKTTRLSDRDSFRPCSTGIDLEALYVRTKMEELESHTEMPTKVGVISTAAHPEQLIAIENAKREAIERVSLAAWWALERQPIAKLSQEDILKEIIDPSIGIPEDFALHIGFVEPVENNYWVACCILENQRSYPFIVLGGSCETDPIKAAKKAFYEAIQSWTGTNWIDEHLPPDKKIFWDLGELKRRIASFEDSPLLNHAAENEKPLTKDLGFFSNKDIRSTHNDGTFIVEIVDGTVTGHLTSQLARLAMKENEELRIYTPHNF